MTEFVLMENVSIPIRKRIYKGQDWSQWGSNRPSRRGAAHRQLVIKEENSK